MDKRRFQAAMHTAAKARTETTRREAMRLLERVNDLICDEKRDDDYEKVDRIFMAACRMHDLPIGRWPELINDCDQCTFLGNWYQYELYFCSKKSARPGGTLIARFGSEEGEYAAELVIDTEKNLRPLRELVSPVTGEGDPPYVAIRVAWLLAGDMGLLKGNEDAESSS